ncbi:MAG: hypothetical protein IKK92_07960 [Prevotella sp.]|nr:hypothetical protein [Prevotella sp.]
MSFEAESMKKAYMDACKWYATNVLSKDELHNVQVEFEKKMDNEQFPTVVIHLFAVLSEDELRDRHCKVCREVHSSFFMNQHYNCNRCETNAYQKRTNDMLKIKLDYYKGLISKRVKEDE